MIIIGILVALFGILFGFECYFQIKENNYVSRKEMDMVRKFRGW